MTRSLAILLLAIALQAGAPPDTDVFLAPLTAANGTIAVGTPENISESPGYDNQPSFTPDGRAVLFTSGRGTAPAPATPGASPGAPQTDIYRYEIAARRVSRVTDTPESEYSPTVTPDGSRISVIRVEADSSQRLWSFTLDGLEPSLVLQDVKPVGYHAWIDANRLALFVLGQPATLQVADTRTGKSVVLATDIGRSIQRMPDGGISFVHRERATEGVAPTLTIKKLSPAGEVTTLTAPVAGAAQPDLAWTPDGVLLMAHSGRLYAWRAGQSGWTPIADLAAAGLRNVSRLAVSPAGDRLAIVADAR
jgi:dipeptidyl aminopeptidase/acylaminoacyl peptidase